MEARSELMTDAAAAELLGVSRATLWRRAKDGTLPKPVRIGNATRWVRSELNEVIARAIAERDGKAA
ncbi:MAG: helix-turn-helix transcriptional regulator [Pseudomonadota bacterium]